jgi:hypothetical protein
VAELRHQGHRAGPYVRFRRIDGVFHYHALVMRYRPVLQRSETGLIEHLVPLGLDDPSRVLGMVPATPAEIEEDE